MYTYQRFVDLSVEPVFPDEKRLAWTIHRGLMGVEPYMSTALED
jgi:hypothetical protein